MPLDKKTLFVDARWLAQPGQGVYTYFHEIYSRIALRDIPELQLIFGILPGHSPAFLPASARVVEYASDSFLWRQVGLGRLLNRLRPDFAHFQYVLPWGLDRRIHTLVALHDVIFLEHPEFFPLAYRLTRRVFFGSSARRADTLLTISDKSARDIHKHFGIPLGQIRMLPLGAGSRLRHLQPSPVTEIDGQPFLLTVGRHEPRKNYPRLIEAYAQSGLFEQRGLRLVIAGWIAEEFRRELATLPAGVHMLTDCNDAELAWLYAQARGFVFPSIAEGYGLPLVEALEFGLPAAASTTYPIDDVRQACLSTFDPYATADISASLLALADAKRSPAPATISIPTWDDHVDRLLDIILRAPRKT